MNMRYKLEIFIEKTNSWFVISSSDSLDVILIRYQNYKNNDLKNHYRVVQVIDFIQIGDKL